MTQKKMILIGIDGGDWTILKPLIEDGKLPTFSHLLQEGVHGTLLSTLPPYSLPSWTSIFTGVNPGKHGLTDWIIKDRGEFKVAITRYRMVNSIWRLLSDAGINQIIINDPVTYPPEKINGIMLTGFLNPSTTNNYFYPSHLKEENNKILNESRFKLNIDPKYLVRLNKIEGLEIINESAQKTTDLAIHFSANYNWDFLTVIFTSSDRLLHFYFDDPQCIESHFKTLDDSIKKIIDLEPNCNILIVSDHGFGPMHKLFYINSWLKRNGLIRLSSAQVISSLLSTINLTYKNVITWLFKLKIYKIISNNIPWILKRIIPVNKEGNMLINYKKSYAFSITNGGIYLNERWKKKIDILYKKLKKCAVNDEKPIKKVYKGEDIFWGPYVERGPDIIILPNCGYEISPKLSQYEIAKLKEVYDNRSGTHTLNGMFIAYGPDFKKGKYIESNIKTWDIAPTILYMFNLNPPSYMDGHVLHQILKSNKKPASMQVIRISEKTRIKEAVKKIRARRHARSDEKNI